MGVIEAALSRYAGNVCKRRGVDCSKAYRGRNGGRCPNKWPKKCDYHRQCVGRRRVKYLNISCDEICRDFKDPRYSLRGRYGCHRRRSKKQASQCKYCGCDRCGRMYKPKKNMASANARFQSCENGPKNNLGG